MKQVEYDVIIIGAGIVGLTLATLLTEQSLKILIIDRQFPQAVSTPFSMRVSAITHASYHIFQRVGLWQQLDKHRVAVYQNMEIYTENGKQALHLNAQRLQEANLGFIIENQELKYRLWQILQNNPLVESQCVSDIEQIVFNQAYATVMTDNQKNYTAKLLIGADGAHSKVRRLSQIELMEKPYHQQAIIANIKLAKSHEHTAWQRFLTTGPCAILPFHDLHHSSIVYSQDQAQANELMALSDTDFAHHLTQISQARFGEVEVISQRKAFPLIKRQAQQYIQNRLALVGDSCHTIHPLAGQGLNLGLMDAALLAQIINDAALAQIDFGVYSVLKQYERGRKSANIIMSQMMDYIHRFYTGHNLPLRIARFVGFELLGHCRPLQQQIVGFALGKHGEIPRYALEYQPSI